MMTSNMMNNNLLQQIVPSKILGKVTNFCGLSLHIKKVVKGKSPCGQFHCNIQFESGILIALMQSVPD